MKEFFENLMLELHNQIEGITVEKNRPTHSEMALQIWNAGLLRLKAFCATYTWRSTEEEIEFFKKWKPQLSSQILYYHELYTIQTNRPIGSDKRIRKYLKGEIERLQACFDENSEFCRYNSKDCNHLDTQYFTRRGHDLKLAVGSFYYFADQTFTTSHDYLLATIWANDRVRKYLEEEMLKYSRRKSTNSQSTNSKALKWTASKVALVELVYALHTEGVFNNGTTRLSETAAYFETVFGINLGHYTRVFLEIRSRKAERTKFLNTLREKLVFRMDETDNL